MHKFRVGQKVYSYQNPTKKARISHVRPSAGKGSQVAYKLALKDKEGYSHSSKWINESSIKRRPKTKYYKRKSHRMHKR